MFRAREDLEQSIAELKHVVQEKVDVKARAKVAVEKGKMIAHDVYERGRQSAREYALRGKESARHLLDRGEDRAYFTYLKAKDRPILTGSLLAGIVATGLLVYFVGRRRCWW
jgi:hypothetical protein